VGSMAIMVRAAAIMAADVSRTRRR